jgi:hypothetical protein
VDLIKQHTTFLGDDGEAVMREIQEDATKTGRLPADIARVIERYCIDLGRRVALQELANELEKGKEQERLLQLESMWADSATDNQNVPRVKPVRYHCGGWSEELNSRILLLALMVYL